MTQDAEESSLKRGQSQELTLCNSSKPPVCIIIIRIISLSYFILGNLMWLCVPLGTFGPPYRYIKNILFSNYVLNVICNMKQSFLR